MSVSFHSYPRVPEASRVACFRSPHICITAWCEPFYFRLHPRFQNSLHSIMGFNDWVAKANQAVAESFVGKRFRLEGSGHRLERKGSRFFTEIRAGLATFFAMAYIISVNSNITSQSGGACVCEDTADDPTCDLDSAYMLCVQVVQRDLVTATAAIAALTSFSMGLFANSM